MTLADRLAGWLQDSGDEISEGCLAAAPRSVDMENEGVAGATSPDEASQSLHLPVEVTAPHGLGMGFGQGEAGQMRTVAKSTGALLVLALILLILLGPSPWLRGVVFGPLSGYWNWAAQCSASSGPG